MERGGTISSSLRVDSSKLSVKKAYVCWIDIMGTKTIMSESFQRAVNFILRFHACCLQSIRENRSLRFYPLMDGCFIIAKDQRSISSALNLIIGNMAELFVGEKTLAHRFVIRGALAYGELSQGESITEDVCLEISKAENYRQGLLFGLPMIQAYTSEKNAPPFGIYIHESARKVGSFQGRYYSWCNDLQINDRMVSALHSYFAWCKRFSYYLEMEPQKIDYYDKLVSEYYSNRNTLIEEDLAIYSQEDKGVVVENTD